MEGGAMQDRRKFLRALGLAPAVAVITGASIVLGQPPVEELTEAYAKSLTDAMIARDQVPGCVMSWKKMIEAHAEAFASCANKFLRGA
jgi:hypothetical protein